MDVPPRASHDGYGVDLDEKPGGQAGNDTLPAWTSNRLKRLVRRAKRYVVDARLIAAALPVDVDAVIRDGDLLGRVLDTFVATQIRAELPVSSKRPRLFHAHSQQGRNEIDLLAELSAGRVVGIEVKASAMPIVAAPICSLWG